MPAPENMPGDAPELNKPAFLSIGVALASSAVMCTGLALYNLDRWDSALRLSAETAERVMAEN